MSEPSTETRAVVVERELPYAPDKVWRAITQSNLISEWLMKNDFQPTVDHAFQFSGDWGAVQGKVLAAEPGKKLAYTWSAMGLESVVTWTLTPTGAGTHLRMEQSGFKDHQEQFYQGALHAWPGFLQGLQKVLEGMD